MRYSGSLVKKEREKIFQLFMDKIRLKFNEIEKELKIRSNLVSYHLMQMQKENLLSKIGEYYYLTEEGEKYLPIFAQVIGEKFGPVPVILVAVFSKDKILLIQRNRRPYKNYWSLIGGKMLLNENLNSASLRMVQEKTGLKSRFVSVNAVLHEQVYGEKSIKHSFFLFFTKVKAKSLDFKETEHGKLRWFKLKEILLEKMIPSDLWLITNKIRSKIHIQEAKMEERAGELSGFQITD